MAGAPRLLSPSMVLVGSCGTGASLVQGASKKKISHGHTKTKQRKGLKVQTEPLTTAAQETGWGSGAGAAPGCCCPQRAQVGSSPALTSFRQREIWLLPPRVASVAFQPRSDLSGVLVRFIYIGCQLFLVFLPRFLQSFSSSFEQSFFDFPAHREVSGSALSL